MIKKQQTKLTNAYRKYQKKKKRKNDVLSFFRDYEPQMILRTMRLEGEKITQKMLGSLFE